MMLRVWRSCGTLKNVPTVLDHGSVVMALRWDAGGSMVQCPAPLWHRCGAYGATLLSSTLSESDITPHLGATTSTEK
jgi:hypothetical protein